ncbi:MAG TPA: hypothetical protein VFJ94_12465 [Intrasporangium sp.]|uniref:hypothetical protein n=1 Tax=Intrasporangium sp. TaxID=1925024 RepID=UPI002D79FA70|nr:hypothetical protein [Intrasporangium sp.]HET7399323.1 hypothetical protein [Intrasporangium sp.]
MVVVLVDGARAAHPGDPADWTDNPPLFPAVLEVTLASGAGAGTDPVFAEDDAVSVFVGRKLPVLVWREKEAVGSDDRVAALQDALDGGDALCWS